MADSGGSPGADGSRGRRMASRVFVEAVILTRVHGTIAGALAMKNS